ncbi:MULTISPECIES: aldehyde dehydrogenase [Rhodococcus]|uniref:aldehyde dehydrogenase family protein n=1 Tax=Rhodococcus TaxID=1827 RepID=UPI0005DDEEEB|nr:MULTISPECIES: aldehyde dehydrogenase family protein [unclassified Rhodococcus (in: high G+C Gram-positive bacteria)]KJF24630.1 Aldehyde dehydrogenase, thermostable [Rhodococcus sp. AD45]
MTIQPRLLPSLVAGEWRRPDEDRTFEVVNPADVRITVARVAAMTAAEVTQLYDAAAVGADVWRNTPVLERAQIMAKAADNLRARAAEITRDLVAEMGKTTAEAAVEVGKAADFLDYYAGLARLPQGQILADARPNTQTTVRTEPVGIVCLVTPWNDPLLTPARKLAPALYTGNAVVLKAASETPVVSMHLAQALQDAGLPAGVLGLASGKIAEIGDALLDDPLINAVSFTGSTAVGRSIQRRLAGRDVRLQTEMGGKNAAVVLADADVELAVAAIAAASFGQAGQRCTATSRVVVDAAVATDVISGIIAAAAAVRLGPGDAPDTAMGPLVSKRAQSDVLAHVERARESGAEVVVGGHGLSTEMAEYGCWVAPTVVTNVERSMPIWTDEVFGPVVAIQVVDGLDEAVAAANDTTYGLAASVFTTSMKNAYYFADRLEAGQVSVNHPTTGWDVHMPFGGFGESGSAFKEQGLEGPRFYTRVKTVAIRTDVER